ncbi:hypothetical protein BT93_J1658 [Corymbia citriodora subsp. variegata]|nr:hypothetical protein BT93_J1658 [Corymbia citriodora subsp. variegata]
MSSLRFPDKTMGTSVVICFKPLVTYSMSQLSFLFSAGLLYEVNKISGSMLSKSEPKTEAQSY